MRGAPRWAQVRERRHSHTHAAAGRGDKLLSVYEGLGSVFPTIASLGSALTVASRENVKSHPLLEQRGVHADVTLAFPRSLRSETSVFGETPVLKALLFSRKS